MKRAFAFLLSTLCVMSMLAYDFQSGNLYYDITSNVAPYTVEVTSGNIDYSGDITIPSSVTYNGITYAVTGIGSRAFMECSSLTSVTIPNSVTSIGEFAFYNCSSLTSVTIPNSVTSIGDWAFYDCSSLPVEKNLRYADTYLVEAVDKTLFTYSIKEGTKWIGNDAFYYCSSLTSITIPNSVTSIGKWAFQSCSSLTSVTIGNSVTSIGDYAFRYCSSLTSITIPNSVTSIGEYAFNGCSGLKSMVVESGNTVYDSRGNCNAIIETATNTLIAACQNTIIPNSVTSIGNDAFNGCSSLTSITIPNSVTSIGWSAFDGCSSLTSITIPNSVTSIGKWAFQSCSSLTSVTIGNSVTSIGDYAFRYCSSLTSITIPNSVTSIGEYAFNGCSGLKSMVVESGNTVYDSRGNCNAIIETATNTLIAGCQNTIIPNSVTSIGVFAFEGCSSLTSITIPNSVTSIGDRAFYSCSSLTSITIPNSVTSIGSYAFDGCSSLTSVTIPNSVTSIGSSAFAHCYRLTSITIPESVTSIGDWAFENCSSLNTIYVEATNSPALGNSTFAGTPSPICYIPCGTKAAYEASDWAQYVSEFVEDCDYGSYTRTVRIGYNTICLPHGSSNFTGATFYEIAHILKNKKKIFFDEVKTLEAGKPYIFYPHSNEVTVYYDNTTSAVPLSHNGLHGTFDGITAASNFLKGKYLVAGDRMVLCGDGCSLAANRAYIELDEISDKDHPAIPGIKRVSMDYSEENATTALDNITDESIVAPMQEGIYDILGRKVDAPTVSGFYIINGKKVFVAL